MKWDPEDYARSSPEQARWAKEFLERLHLRPDVAHAPGHLSAIGQPQVLITHGGHIAKFQQIRR